VDHLRRGDVLLADLLEHSDVLMHPFVVGEIACGSLADRTLVLELLQQLPAAMVAEPDEALGYIERRKLPGKGLGYIDVHLLASAAIGNTKLWTRDRRLRAAAQELGCDFAEMSSL
jgi:predicted nucleic acid-binding protein